MKKFAVSSLVAGLLMANVAGADPVAVKNGAIFMVSKNALSVQPVDPTAAPLPAACALAKPMSIPGATDVVISNGDAIVTIKDPGTGVVTGVDVVDVSSCLLNFCDAQPTVDLHSGELFIPCLEVNGKSYDITMHQRGNSMNWEVVGLPESEHEKHGHDHEDDDHHKN
ncbi:hypothetical protein [Methylobacter sp.]|uniref:hypothetical protein n=1 Tax=Methylobacter sp. TaxID=2051955 RepID=UPI003DA63B40